MSTSEGGRGPFPVYGLDNPAAPAELAGHGSDRSGTTRVRIDQGDMMVESETGRRAPEGPASTCDACSPTPWAARTEWPDVSHPAMTLWLNARERERSAAALRGDSFTLDVLVDGEPVPFAGLRSGGTWALAGHVGDVRVSIRGRGLEPGDVRLRRLDPLPGGTAAG